MSALTQGRRVLALSYTGEWLPGSVAYVRFSPESGYRDVCAVSVVLDRRAADPGYSGSIFSVEKVKAV